MAPRDNRKFYAIYVSFIELGAPHLANEDSWVTLATIQSEIVDRIDAGISQVTRRILRRLFIDGATNPTLAGLTLGDPTVHGDSLRIFIALGAFVMDGAAFAEIMCTYTESALKACPLCVNFFAEKSGLVNEDDGVDILTCAAADDSNMLLATDKSTWSAIDRLSAAHARIGSSDPLIRSTRWQ